MMSKTIFMLSVVFLWALIMGCQNPQRPVFGIEFHLTLDSSSEVSAFIFSASGNKISTLMEKSPLNPRQYSIGWSGLNDDGERVVEGVYYFRIEIMRSGVLTDTIVQRFIVD